VGSDYGVVPVGQAQMRVSSAERERAIDVLKAAFAEGRLDQDEYAERVGQAYRSKTYGELGLLIADLPVGPLGTAGPILVPVPVLAGQFPHRRLVPQTNGMSIAALILGLGAFFTVGATAVPAIVLGIAGHYRAGVKGQRGRVMAAIGALAGALAIPLLVHLLNLIGSN
jgi:uncharacterized protein DUF1707